MMKSVKTRAVKTLVAATFAVSAMMALANDASAAGDSEYGSISGTVSLTNDYVFRGYSLTNEHAAIQGSLDWSHPSGFNAGVWGSNIDNGGDHLELDWYAGYSGEVKALSYSATIVYYTYPSSNANDEYWEGLFSVGYDFGFLSSSLGIGYSPSQASLGHDDATWIYGDLTVPVPLQSPLAPYVFAHLGYQDTAFHTSGYWEWNGGIGFHAVGLDFKAMYVDTDVKAVPAASSRFVISVSKSM